MYSSFPDIYSKRETSWERSADSMSRLDAAGVSCLDNSVIRTVLLVSFSLAESDLLPATAGELC